MGPATHHRTQNSAERRWHLSIALAIGLMQVGDISCHSHPTSSGSSRSSESRNSIVPVITQVTGGGLYNASATLQRDRIEHVRYILNERVHYNQAGLRDRDFAKWNRERRGNSAVVSTHDLKKEEEQASTRLPQNVLSSRRSTRRNSGNGDANTDANHVSGNDVGLYAADMLNLDLQPIPSLPSLFPGKPMHHIDNKKPSKLRLLFRGMNLSLQFAPVLSTVWLAYISTKFREGIWYKWIANCLASSGPAFIKWGQWASTREDMFPASLCDALTQLHNEAPSHSWKHTRNMVESSLGLPKDGVLQVFESFDTRPIASGSIAQIHKAVLRASGTKDGTTVAVKVRHPNVARLIAMDFRLMSFLARLADSLPSLSWLHVRDSVEQFSHTMAAQSHLNVEAHHLEMLNHNFRKWQHVKFPEPLYASSSVIIETFEPGRIITNILDNHNTIASSQNGKQTTLTVEEVTEDDEGNINDVAHLSGPHAIPIKLAKFIVSNGLSLYLKMLLVDNLMHADLHPGNMMIDLHADYHQPKSSRRPRLPTSQALSSDIVTATTRESLLSERYRITLVDAGMVAQLTDTEAANFIGLLSSLGEGDGISAAKFVLRFYSKDDINNDNTLNEEQRSAFINDMDTLFQETCNGYGTNVDFGNVLRGVLGVVRKYHVRIDANYATLVVNALCVESLGRQVCPSYNVLDASKPLLQSFRRMCVDRDGKPRDQVIRKKGSLVRVWMSVLYWKKKVSDDKFFRELALINGDKRSR